jgi:hypothetical protein
VPQSFKEFMRGRSDAQLRVIRDFFDAPGLRHHYSGLLSDIASELDRRSREAASARIIDRRQCVLPFTGGRAPKKKRSGGAS